LLLVSVCSAGLEVMVMGYKNTTAGIKHLFGDRFEICFSPFTWH